MNTRFLVKSRSCISCHSSTLYSLPQVAFQAFSMSLCTSGPRVYVTLRLIDNPWNVWQSFLLMTVKYRRRVLINVFYEKSRMGCCQFTYMSNFRLSTANWPTSFFVVAVFLYIMLRGSDAISVKRAASFALFPSSITRSKIFQFGQRYIVCNILWL